MLKGFPVFSEGLVAFTRRSVYSDWNFHVTIYYPGGKKTDWMYIYIYIYIYIWVKPRNVNALREDIDD